MTPENHRNPDDLEKRAFRVGPDHDPHSDAWDSRHELSDELDVMYDDADHLLHSGFFIEASSLALRMVKHDQTNPYLLDFAGVCLSYVGLYRESLAAFQDAIKYTPEDRTADLTKRLAHLGGAQMIVGDFLQAEKSFARALDLDGANGLAVANKGILEFQKQNFSNAVLYLETALELAEDQPALVNMRYGLILTIYHCYGETGNTEKQSVFANKIRRTLPDHAWVIDKYKDRLEIHHCLGGNWHEESVPFTSQQEKHI